MTLKFGGMDKNDTKIQENKKDSHDQVRTQKRESNEMNQRFKMKNFQNVRPLIFEDSSHEQLS